MASNTKLSKFYKTHETKFQDRIGKMSGFIREDIERTEEKKVAN